MATVDDVTTGKIMTIADDRGSLVICEQGRDVDYPVSRLFFVRPDAAGRGRGGHAHIACRQTLVCVSGRVTTTCDDGREKRTFVQEAPDDVLVIPAGIWAEQVYETDDAVLLVLCDQLYDEADYIRDYDAFLARR